MKDKQKKEDEIEFIQSNTELIIKNRLSRLIFGCLFLSLMLPIMVLSQIDNFSWTPTLITPGILLFFYIVIKYKSCLKFAKSIIIVDILYDFYILFFFSALGSSCILHLYGQKILYIEILLKCLVTIVLCIYSFKLWLKKWEKYEGLNKDILFDTKNSRFNYIDFFRKGLSIPSEESTIEYKMNNLLLPLAPIIGSVGLGISLSFSGKSFLYIFLIASLVVISLLMPKYIVKRIVIYSKLLSYEKESGTTMLNGLLEEKKEIK